MYALSSDTPWVVVLLDGALLARGLAPGDLCTLLLQLVAVKDVAKVEQLGLTQVELASALACARLSRRARDYRKVLLFDATLEIGLVETCHQLAPIRLLFVALVAHVLRLQLGDGDHADHRLLLGLGLVGLLRLGTGAMAL